MTSLCLFVPLYSKNFAYPPYVKGAHPYRLDYADSESLKAEEEEQGGREEIEVVF